MYKKCFNAVCVWFLALAVLLPAAVGAAVDEEQSVQLLRRLGKAFATIAESSSPAVVGVKAESTSSGKENPAIQQLPFGDQFDPFDDDFFDQFFRGRRPRRPGRTPRYKSTAQGSGFIISDDGYILTNNHLVGEADKVIVKLDDGSEKEAQIIGSDPDSDVAVLKVDAENLPFLKLADSDALQVGEWVIAIGNPFGLAHTVTAGIVSAKGRSNVGLAAFEDFIQTDAAINPGNSGGPLLNLDGQVVGLNTAIISRSGGNMGIGLAIPVNMARNIYEQLKDGGTVARGFLGVVIQDLTPRIAESFGLPQDTRGVLVPEVVKDSAADKAGLKHNDIIVELNGKPMEKADVFRNTVAMISPGTTVDLVILRDGSRRNFEVELGDRPKGPISAHGRVPELMDKLGFSVQELTDDLARRLGYTGLSGVIIADIEPGSPAEEARLSPGSLIMEVDRQAIESPEQFYEAMERAGAQSVLLLVRDRNYTRFVVLPLPEE